MAQNLVGQWDFNKGDITATVGLDLSYSDPATAQQTQFGTTTALGIPTIGGTDANVMKFPACTGTMGFLMTAPSTANGGGSLVNEWSLVMDVLYPTASDGKTRPIIDTDGSLFVAGPEFVVDGATDGIGSPPNGPYRGKISPNTWYRVGITTKNSEIDIYINGSQVGALSSYALDGRFALSPAFQNLILADNISTNAAIGYLNSLQLWDAALNPGQMLALGGPSAAGMPTNIPPVPSFIASRSPGVGATVVLPTPAIKAVINQGSTTVDSSSIKLWFDGSPLPADVVAAAPTFSVTAAVTNLLDPSSVHNVTLLWSDNVAGASSNTWSFTVMAYQSITLPAPFYLETFDEVAEGTLPTGWVVTNATTVQGMTPDLCDPTSSSYQDWVVINTNRLCAGGPCAGFECSVLNFPPIAVNGALIDSLGRSNIIFFESDNRCNSCYGQNGVLFSPDIDCTGKTNVFISFHSLYLQNQDSVGSLEYSIDQGKNWLPILYYIADTDGTSASGSDVITNSSGVIDAVATLNTARSDQPGGGTNYGFFIGAPVSQALAAYIQPEPDDEASSITTYDGVSHFAWIGKSIETIRLNNADGQSHVRLRFMYAGTCSWYWGVDEVGLYVINTPNITSQPASETVSAGSTATFTVAAQSDSPLTYKWQRNGTTLSDNGHLSGTTNATLTISSCTTNDAGSYVCVVGNSSGTVKTLPATLTVVVVPQITTQPQPVVTSAGLPVTLTAVAIGQPPLTYTWLKNGTPTGQTGSTLLFSSIQASDAGSYQVGVSNSAGGTLSAIARVIVAPTAFSNSLVVHITFDGNYNDSSGRGNNATAVGNPTLVAGKFGQAMQFTTKSDGSEFDYATLGYPNDLKFGVNVDFSISFWANYTQQVDDPPFISNKNWDSSGNPGWGLFTQNNGHYRVNVTGTGGTKYDLGSSVTPLVRDGTWHNIVLSYARGAIVSVYTDGVLTSTGPDLTTGSIDTDSLGYHVNIGQDGRGTYTDGGSAGITNALIDDLGIWTRALSPQEAASIYTSGQAGKDLSQVVVGTTPSKVTISFHTSGGNLVLTWPGAPTVKLQTTTNLSSPSWTDVPGTLGASTYSAPLNGGKEAFFRLSQ
jgi:hypothetical protein